MGIGSNVQDALDEFLMILSISVTVQGAKVFICSEEANRTEFRSKDKGATSFSMACSVVLMFAILDTKKSLKAVARSSGFARFGKSFGLPRPSSESTMPKSFLWSPSQFWILRRKYYDFSCIIRSLTKVHFS